MTFFLTWLGNLLGGPFARAAVDAYSKKLDAENSSQKIAADLASRELVVEQREAELNSQRALLGPWWSPEHLLGYIMVSYIGKCIVWDNMLGSLTHGNTDALRGDVAVWSGWILAFWLGKRGIENVAAIIKRG